MSFLATVHLSKIQPYQTIMNPSAPLVGVICCIKPVGALPFHAVGVKYVDAVVAGAGCLPLLIPALGEKLEVSAVLAHIDGLLLTGSVSNVAPQRYGEALEGEEHFDPARDDTVFRLIHATVAAGIPLLAICRGLQEVNVAFGGTLRQQLHESAGRQDHRADADADLSDQYAPAHRVRLAAGGALQALLPPQTDEILVNSLHSQGIERLGAGLIAEAWAEDGLIEALRIRDAQSFALAVQWHPEWQVTENAPSLALFRAFGAACKRRMENKTFQ